MKAIGLSKNEAKTQVKTKKFYVTMKISARYNVEVTAPEIADSEDIIAEANKAFFDADFGDAEDIDGEAIIIEDEKGNYIYEA